MSLCIIISLNDKSQERKKVNGRKKQMERHALFTIRRSAADEFARTQETSGASHHRRGSPPTVSAAGVRAHLHPGHCGCGDDVITHLFSILRLQRGGALWADARGPERWSPLSAARGANGVTAH